MVEHVSGLMKERGIMTGKNRYELTGRQIDLLGRMFNEAVNGFNTAKYGSVISDDKDFCRRVWKKLDDYGSVEGSVIEYDMLSPDEWVIVIEVMRVVMLDFNKYDEYHTRMGFMFQDCLNLFSNVALMAVRYRQ